MSYDKQILRYPINSDHGLILQRLRDSGITNDPFLYHSAEHLAWRLVLKGMGAMVSKPETLRPDMVSFQEENVHDGVFICCCIDFSGIIKEREESEIFDDYVEDPSEKGLCSNCGEKPVENDRTMCDDCIKLEAAAKELGLRGFDPYDDYFIYGNSGKND